MVASKKKTHSLKEPLKIGIDCRLWDQSGVGRYIRNLVTEIAKKDKTNFYYLFFLKETLQKESFKNLPKNFIKVEANFGWYGVSEQIQFPKLLNQYKLDLVHFPHFNVPMLYKGKFVVTIHDLIHQHFAMSRATTLNPVTYRVKQLGYRRIFYHAVTKSLKILTPSDFVKYQLVETWSVPSEKVIVTPEGVEENLLNLTKLIKKDAFSKLAQKIKLKGKYIYYLGNAHPHKNVERLLQAFQLLRKDYPDLSLVLSGPDHYFWQRIKRENSVEGVIFTGFVSDQELVTLYKNAECYVVPSLEEGFGIPLLEAMACGCPIVSSERGSLKEVGGDAAIYFNPENINQIKSQIEKVLTQPKLRSELIEKGKKRYKQFSWQKLADQTLKTYTDARSL